MKKKLIKIIVCFLMLIGICFLSSCNLFKNKYTTMENGVDITVPDDWKQHFLYPEDVPSMHFGYNGINVLSASTKDHYTLVENDFYKQSDAFAKFLSSFGFSRLPEDIDVDDYNYIITKATKRSEENVSARTKGKNTLKLDQLMEDPNRRGSFIAQECSMEYLVVGFGEDGTRYSCSFRTFVSDGKRYYAFAWTGNLEIKMNMPIMVVKENDEKKLLLLPLPYDTKYTVSNNARLDAIMKKDSYLDESNYVFDYPNVFYHTDYVIDGSEEKLPEYTPEQKRELVIKWYEKYCKGEYIEGVFYVEYAGARFIVNLDAGSSKDAFSLKYVGPATK